MEVTGKREAWNKDKLVGQKPPLKPKDIWAFRIYLQNAHAVRDLAISSRSLHHQNSTHLRSTLDGHSSWDINKCPESTHAPLGAAFRFSAEAL